jgi:hypothetical protein
MIENFFHLEGLKGKFLLLNASLFQMAEDIYRFKSITEQYL